MNEKWVAITKSAVYASRYKDGFGEEHTTIMNDGGLLTMVVRDVQFQGNDFDMFEPKDVSDTSRLSSFKFLHGRLCFCVIEGDIPVPVETPSGIVNGLLTFELKLEGPLPTGQMNDKQLKLRLAVNEQTFSSQGKTGHFDGEMLDLQNQLPDGTFMKVCFNCAFSDYSPYGHSLFGTMICFRANKTGYLALSIKEEDFKDHYFDVMDTVSEIVQETYLCPEFERRVPGTGYRG